MSLSGTRRKNGVLQAELRAAAYWESPGCYLLTGHKIRPHIVLIGHGERRTMAASRAVWVIRHGDPGKAHVLHRCGNGEAGCISIQCLYLGDHARNMADEAEAGTRKGSRHHNSKLTEDQVREIRARLAGGQGDKRSLAKEYGVSESRIGQIFRGEGWTHV